MNSWLTWDTWCGQSQARLQHKIFSPINSTEWGGAWSTFIYFSLYISDYSFGRHGVQTVTKGSLFNYQEQQQKSLLKKRTMWNPQIIKICWKNKEEIPMILIFSFYRFSYLYAQEMTMLVDEFPTNPTKVQVILHSSSSSFLSLVDIHTYDYGSG